MNNKQGCGKDKKKLCKPFHIPRIEEKIIYCWRCGYRIGKLKEVRE